MSFDFEEFKRERDEALLTMDIDKVLDYCIKYEIPIPLNPAVLIAGLHKARCHATTIPEELREESRAWLEAHGMSADLR